jgi:endonuclease YncB( thermonuclease family)
VSSRRLPFLIVLAFLASGCDESAPGTVTPIPEGNNTIIPEVLDGDSLRTSDGNEYRLIGINAPDRGECLADAAASRLEELVRDGVTFETDRELEDQFGRKLVYAFTDGTLINEQLVAEGMAVVLHSEPNSGATERILAAMERAVGSQVGLWDPGACGGGETTTLEIVDIQADPRGPDEHHLEEEYVVLENTGADSVDLTGWSLRDESTRNRYSFPDGFVLGPGERVTVTAGPGPFGFGSDTPIWNNSGDTAFLVDPGGRFVTFASTTASAGAAAN